MNTTLLTETQESQKPSLWEEILRVLRRALRWCICCLTCGCVPVPEDTKVETELRRLNLTESEKLKIVRFLKKLEPDKEQFVLEPDDIHAWEIMTFSESASLQKVSAHAFLRVSQSRGFTLTRDMVIPLINLVRSEKLKVQKPAAVAVSNFVLYRSEKNRRLLVEGGIIKCLNNLALSPVCDIVLSATSSIVSISTSDAFKENLVLERTVPSLLKILPCSSTKVQRNIVGAILNLTHEGSLLDDLVSDGVIPPLVQLLSSSDTEILYYVTAALCNLATTNRYRTMITAVGFSDSVQYLIKFIETYPEKLQCQSCLTLRNFTSDSDNQETVLRYGVLPVLQRTIKRDSGRVLVPSLALLQNISAYPSNWNEIVSLDIHVELCEIVQDCGNTEAQLHCAVILRNLASSDNLPVLLEAGCIPAIGRTILEPLTNTSVVIEITALLVVAARNEQACKEVIAYKQGALFCKLVAVASISTHHELQYNAASIIGEISLAGLPNDMKLSNSPGLFVYIDNFLKSGDPSFIHLALVTLTQILKDPYFNKMFQRHHIYRVVSHVARSSHPPEILQLAESVLTELQQPGKTK